MWFVAMNTRAQYADWIVNATVGSSVYAPMPRSTPFPSLIHHDTLSEASVSPRTGTAVPPLDGLFQSSRARRTLLLLAAARRRLSVRVRRRMGRLRRVRLGLPRAGSCWRGLWELGESEGRFVLWWMNADMLCLVCFALPWAFYNRIMSR